jgi:predicted DNA-binding protein
MAKRVNFYLTDIQVKRLQMMSKKTGLTASELVRRAVDEYWEKFEKKTTERTRHKAKEKMLKNA